MTHDRVYSDLAIGLHMILDDNITRPLETQARSANSRSYEAAPAGSPRASETQ